MEKKACLHSNSIPEYLGEKQNIQQSEVSYVFSFILLMEFE